MDSMSIEKVSSNTAFSHWKYDVFLSFRGEDTRRNFTDHLYAALNRGGINVFRDDGELEKGKSISTELLEAIEDTRISIIVFSRNYASSTWCLEELTKMVQCMNTMRQMVIPIFYDVDPCVVRRQTGNFKDAFVKHEEAFKENIEKVRNWRMALTEVANLSGWHLNNRHESEFIQDIVKEILSKLSPTTLVTDLIGINSHMEKLRLLVGTRFDDVCMIGICGMGGIGKTTIARCFYELISHEFEGSCFLTNVREKSEKDGLIPLQKQLLSQILMTTDINIWDVDIGINEIKRRLQHKKVLVVIDDVTHVNQMNKLVGKHDWFGLGSIILITTRDKHLLVAHGVDDVYKVEELNDDDALQLFSLKAFKSHKPSKYYVKLSECVVKYANGLPLALEVLGSFLSGKTVDEWISALERLNREPEKEIMDILQLSFDGLKEIEKKIFLDVACFFKGKQIDYVTRIMEGCGFYPIIGLGVLIDKSLITILKNGELWMHDLLQEMGQQIVKKESIEEPGKRSRLWEEEDIYHVLAKNTGTKAVEAIILETKLHLSANAKAFSNMINLRLLKIQNVQLPEGLKYLSNNLRFLKWHGYPLKSLPSRLQLDKVIELEMQCSSIEQLWNGIKPLNKLRFMRLSHSQNLSKIPDCTGVPNLEELILEGCSRLREIHPSLLVHTKLIILNLKDCVSLRTLPSNIYMESLRKLVLSGCSKLNKFPDIVGRMECLSELFLDGTAIKELPLSIGLLTGLVLLNLKDCNNLFSLPKNINGLRSLKALDLSGCSKFENLPDTLGQVQSLEELDVSGTAIREPVSTIFLMENLKTLSFRGCKRSQSKSWDLRFPSKLMSKRSPNPMALMLPSLSSLCSLTKLDLSDCNLCDGAIPSDIGNLASISALDLSKNNFVSLPASISCLSKLENLNLEGCKRLKSLPGLPSSINFVKLNACVSLEAVSNALQLCKSKWSVISCVNCLKLLDKSVALSFLEEYLKASSNVRTNFNIIVPGSEIPKWFSYQSEGYSITVEIPPNLFNNRRLVGYVLCSLFVVQEHLPVLNGKFQEHYLGCSLIYADGNFCRYHPFLSFDEKFGPAVSSHLWLVYWSLDEYFDVKWQNSQLNRIEFLFGSCGLEVKKCGVFPVYI